MKKRWYFWIVIESILLIVSAACAVICNPVLWMTSLACIGAIIVLCVRIRENAVKEDNDSRNLSA